MILTPAVKVSSNWNTGSQILVLLIRASILGTIAIMT